MFLFWRIIYIVLTQKANAAGLFWGGNRAKNGRYIAAFNTKNEYLNKK